MGFCAPGELFREQTQPAGSSSGAHARIAHRTAAATGVFLLKARLARACLLREKTAVRALIFACYDPVLRRETEPAPPRAVTGKNLRGGFRAPRPFFMPLKKTRGGWLPRLGSGDHDKPSLGGGSSCPLPLLQCRNLSTLRRSAGVAGQGGARPRRSFGSACPQPALACPPCAL